MIFYLVILSTWCGIHPVFNKLLLTPYHQGVFSSQEKPKPPPPDIIKQEEEHEIQEVVDSQKHWKSRISHTLAWLPP